MSDTASMSLAPRCSVCGVEYVEDYEGPCQEWRGEFTEHTGWSSVCPGHVSWRATAERLHEALELGQGASDSMSDAHWLAQRDREVDDLTAERDHWRERCVRAEERLELTERPVR